MGVRKGEEVQAIEDRRKKEGKDGGRSKLEKYSTFFEHVASHLTGSTGIDAMRGTPFFRLPKPHPPRPRLPPAPPPVKLALASSAVSLALTSVCNLQGCRESVRSRSRRVPLVHPTCNREKGRGRGGSCNLQMVMEKAFNGAATAIQSVNW